MRSEVSEFWIPRKVPSTTRSFAQGDLTMWSRMCLQSPRKLFSLMLGFKARNITDETDLQSNNHMWVNFFVLILLLFGVSLMCYSIYWSYIWKSRNSFEFSVHCYLQSLLQEVGVSELKTCKFCSQTAYVVMFTEASLSEMLTYQRR